jgi:hypothetical protein
LLDGPYERRERQRRTLGFVLAAVFYGVAYAMARRTYGPAFGFLVTSPILGAFGAWFLVRHGAGARHWLRWSALRKIDGIHHAFDDVAVRIIWHEDQCWVAAQDVFNVLRKPLDADTLRRLRAWCGDAGLTQDEKGEWWFAEATVLRWLWERRARFDRRASRFRLWLERGAFPPMHRKVELRGPSAVP